MSTITLTTDFGLKDGNVGVMKGVIWRIAPQAQIADISHQISPQNVPEAALILLRSTPYFPTGTVHVAVIDPGVGTDRRPVAGKIGGHFFVAPDNGVLTMLFERADETAQTSEFVHLDRPQYWLEEVSSVFHGRDIFAPCAAHLARGVSLHELGTPVADLIRLDLPRPQRTGRSLLGQVIHIDHFGNISSNIRVDHLGHAKGARVRLRGQEIQGLVKTFGERPPGDLVALYGSTGSLIISVVNGSAAARLNASIGDPVEVILP